MSAKIAEEYARFIQQGLWYAHAHEDNAKEFSYLTLGLAGEAGEFADEFKKVVREAGFDDELGYRQLLADGYGEKLIKELGDVLWYLTGLCKLLGINLEQLMVLNAHKLFSRYLEDGDRYPNQEPIMWPFSNPMKSPANTVNTIITLQKTRERRVEKCRNNSQ